MRGTVLDIVLDMLLDIVLGRAGTDIRAVATAMPGLDDGGSIMGLDVSLA